MRIEDVVGLKTRWRVSLFSYRGPCEIIANNESPWSDRDHGSFHHRNPNYIYSRAELSSDEDPTEKVMHCVREPIVNAKACMTRQAFIPSLLVSFLKRDQSYGVIIVLPMSIWSGCMSCRFQMVVDGRVSIKAAGECLSSSSSLSSTSWSLLWQIIACHTNGTSRFYT